MPKLFRVVNAICELTGWRVVGCDVSFQMEVTWLPVYKPSAEERSDAKLFARNVQKVAPIRTCMLRCATVRHR